MSPDDNEPRSASGLDSWSVPAPGAPQKAEAEATPDSWAVPGTGSSRMEQPVSQSDSWSLPASQAAEAPRPAAPIDSWSPPSAEPDRSAQPAPPIDSWSPPGTESAPSERPSSETADSEPSAREIDSWSSHGPTASMNAQLESELDTPSAKPAPSPPEAPSEPSPAPPGDAAPSAAPASEEKAPSDAQETQDAQIVFKPEPEPEPEPEPDDVPVATPIAREIVDRKHEHWMLPTPAHPMPAIVNVRLDATIDDADSSDDDKDHDRPTAHPPPDDDDVWSLRSGSDPAAETTPSLKLAGAAAMRAAEMPHLGLDGFVGGIEPLDGLVVFSLADGSVVGAWMRPDSGLAAEDVATSLRETYRASLQASRKLAVFASAAADRSHAAEPFITIETVAQTVLLRRIRAFVVACLFDASMPLGMARLCAAQLASSLEPELPLTDLERLTLPPPTARGNRPPMSARFALRTPHASSTEIDHARRIIAYTEAHLPDPHAVKLRLSLRAHTPRLALDHPETLASDAVLRVETAAMELLGLDREQLALEILRDKS